MIIASCEEEVGTNIFYRPHVIKFKLKILKFLHLVINLSHTFIDLTFFNIFIARGIGACHNASNLRNIFTKSFKIKGQLNVQLN